MHLVRGSWIRVAHVFLAQEIAHALVGHVVNVLEFGLRLGAQTWSFSQRSHSRSRSS